MTIDVQNASGDSVNCGTIVNGFVSKGVDLIMANATPALTAAVFGIAAGLGGVLPAIASQTFIVQGAVPTIAVLPILATQGKGDVTYAANLVTIGTLLFVIVVPAVMLLIS